MHCNDYLTYRQELYISSPTATLEQVQQPLLDLASTTSRSLSEVSRGGTGARVLRGRGGWDKTPWWRLAMVSRSQDQSWSSIYIVSNFFLLEKKRNSIVLESKHIQNSKILKIKQNTNRCSKRKYFHSDITMKNLHIISTIIIKWLLFLMTLVS